MGNMAQAIRNRRPDGEGFYRQPAAGLALHHRRLSIIDLSIASQQSVVDAATVVVLTYNGEPYHFHAMRSKLHALSHRLMFSGDTELLLGCYLQRGMNFLLQLAGMFALAFQNAFACETLGVFLLCAPHAHAV